MEHTTAPGSPYPELPTFEDLERRRIELGGPPPQPRYTQAPQPPPSARPVLHEAALHGLAGLAVRTLAPHTEAHPAAILLQLLAAFGNLVGRGPHCMVDATRHGLNLFVVLVGESSKARKGTSWNQIARLFAEVEPEWVANRISTSRLTASGLVYALRNQQPATDRRLLALSEEFAGVLNNLKRAQGHLSPLLRSAWDCGDLPALDLHQPLRATAAHISLIAHITPEELAQNLPRSETRNGFANRCLWTCVERSNCLPDGGNLAGHELSAIAGKLRRALALANAEPDIPFTRDPAASDLWHHRYPALSQVRPGLHGAATSRAEAQVLRLSAIYAALDATSTIGLPHLEAALALWNYCSASAALLFGTTAGNPIADRIREAIDAAPEGLSRKQIRSLFHGHVSSDRISTALDQLVSLQAIRGRDHRTAGRSTTLWSPSPVSPNEENRKPMTEQQPGEGA